MRQAGAAIAVLAALGAGPAFAAPTNYDIDFVSEFADACVPGRLSYDASRQAAQAAGWTEVATDAHPELAAMMALSESEAQAGELEDAEFAFASYGKTIGGVPHYLVVSYLSAVIGEPDDPLNPWIYVGCYLYNFDATVPLDPEPVTALIRNPISASREEEGVVSHVWGPPCPMPRTGDTYLSFVAEGSPVAADLPFTGIALNFTTSGLQPGEAVPDPYC